MKDKERTKIHPNITQNANIYGYQSETQAFRAIIKSMENPDTQLEKRLASALREELTDRQREAVVLYYIKRHTMTDTAAEMGVGVSTVSRTLARARLRLRRCLRYGGAQFLNAEDE